MKPALLFLVRATLQCFSEVLLITREYNPPDKYNNLIHQFEALFNYATIGIIVTNKDGAIINFNKHAETQFGFTKEEILNKKVEALLPTGTHSKHIEYREEYQKHPEQKIMGHGRDLLAQRKDGSTFPVEVSLSHYKFENETFVIAFVIDITVRKQQEEMVQAQTQELEKVTSWVKLMNAQLEQKVEDRTKMLREALSELEKSKEELSLAFEKEKDLSELKSRFVTMASHEFRTPLSTILSSSYLLEKYNQADPDPKIEKHVHRIRSAVGGMKNILDDFLSLGKLEEGKVQTTMEPVPAVTLISLLNHLVQELEDLLKPGQHIQMISTLDGEIWIDRHLLKNILINLISNAVKFSGEKGAITVRSLLKDNDLVISVEDNGIGISPDDQQHLFERFFRAENAVNIEGTGLGLHIVSKYLELMNGTIRMHSELNVGTTFTLFIPQAHE